MFDVEKFVGGLHDYLGKAFAPVVARIKVLEDREPKEGLPGKDGSDGKDGVDGQPGKDGVDGKPGENGSDGADGKAGDDGKDGDPGLNGKDGASVEDVLKAVQPILDAAMASWALDFERRAQGVLERAVDRIPHPRDGRDGHDGRDALDLDDFDLAVADDGRTVTMSLRRGDTVVQRSVSFPVVIDRGVFKHGSGYAPGDGVTFAGSFWIARKEGALEKPGLSDDWRLAVKKGRDA